MKGAHAAKAPGVGPAKLGGEARWGECSNGALQQHRARTRDSYRCGPQNQGRRTPHSCPGRGVSSTAAAVQAAVLAGIMSRRAAQRRRPHGSARSAVRSPARSSAVQSSAVSLSPTKRGLRAFCAECEPVSKHAVMHLQRRLPVGLCSRGKRPAAGSTRPGALSTLKAAAGVPGCSQGVYVPGHRLWAASAALGQPRAPRHSVHRALRQLQEAGRAHPPVRRQPRRCSHLAYHGGCRLQAGRGHAGVAQWQFQTQLHTNVAAKRDCAPAAGRCPRMHSRTCCRSVSTSDGRTCEGALGAGCTAPTPALAAQ